MPPRRTLKAAVLMGASIIVVAAFATLTTADAPSSQTEQSVFSTGYVFIATLVVLALVIPGISIYYVSSVRRLFANLPRLERPWLLLASGIGMLSLALLSIAFWELGVLPRFWDTIHSMLLVASTLFLLAAMVLMKRAWTISEAE